MKSKEKTPFGTEDLEKEKMDLGEESLIIQVKERYEEWWDIPSEEAIRYAIKLTTKKERQRLAKEVKKILDDFDWFPEQEVDWEEQIQELKKRLGLK